MENFDPSSVKSQLTDLFNHKDNHAERIAALEILGEQQKEMATAINKSSIIMEKWVADAHRVLYGDDKLGIQGLVKQHNKMWVSAQRIAIGGVVVMYFCKELGIIDKLLLQ